MRDSLDSSIRQYETGAPALIDLAAILNETPGVHGARFSGAGFRGCCVALVEADAATDVVAEVGPRLVSLHISDNDGAAEKHWFPGEGVIDFVALMRALARAGFDGSLVLEVGAPTPHAPLDETLRTLSEIGRCLLRGKALRTT